MGSKNDELWGTSKDSNQIKFKISLFTSNLCDCSNANIFISWTITIKGEGDEDATKRTDERNKGVIFKNSMPFNDCEGSINVTQIDNAKDIAVVMPMYN